MHFPITKKLKKKKLPKPVGFLKRKFYLTNQLSLTSHLGSKLYPTWQKRRVLKTRRLPDLNLSLSNNDSDTQIYQTCYLPSLIRLVRRQRRLKFKTFKSLSYVERRQCLQLFSFFQQQKPQLLIKKQSLNKERFLMVNQKDYTSLFTVKTELNLNDEEQSLEEFSYCFVKGGLLSQRCLSSYRWTTKAQPYYDGGTPDVITIENQKKKKKLFSRRRRRLRIKSTRTKVYKLFRRYQKKNRKVYRSSYGPKSLKIKKDKNYLHTFPQSLEANKTWRFWRVLKVVPPQWLTVGVTRDVFFNLQLKLKSLIGPSHYSDADRPRIYDDLKISYHRRLSLDQLNARRYQSYQVKSYQLIQSRWKTFYRGARQIDPIRSQWSWSIKHKGSILNQRDQFVSLPSYNHSQVLTNRLKILSTQLLQLKNVRAKAERYLKHTQVIFKLPKAKKLRLDRRRYYQRRLLRLRRHLEKLPSSVDNYYSFLNGQASTYYQFNRFAKMELNQSIRPSTSILNFYQFEQQIRNKAPSSRFFFGLYYTFFLRDATRPEMRGWTRDRRRRKRTLTGELRMRPLRDHKIWGKFFKDERDRRFSFLRDNAITRFTRRLNLKRYKKVPTKFAQLYLYTQKVDTRRKLDGPDPENRSMMNFFLSFTSGLIVEKKQKKVFPTTLGMLFSFNRATLNLETFFRPLPVQPLEVVEKKEKVEEFEKIVITQRPPVRPSKLRKLKYYSWFYLGRPLHLVYYYCCRLINFILLNLIKISQDFRDQFQGWLLFYQKLFLNIFIDIPRLIVNSIQGLRIVRLLVWVYTSWLYVDALENEPDEDHAEYEEWDQARDLYNEDDHDPDHDRISVGEDNIDSELGYNYNESQSLSPSSLWFYGNPMWEWYLHNVPTDQIEDLFDETNYFTRLVFRPFVDFIVRLPLWSMLELISLWLEVFKSEYHRCWYKILTYKNQPNRIVGRWWKIPLVLIKLGFRLVIWGSFFFYLVSLITAEDLKILCTYNFSFPWFEEYYYFYVATCFMLSVYLVGPLSLRDFCFKELGLENLLYLFVVPASVANPEAYQPQRSSFKIYQHLSRWDLNYAAEKEPPVGEEYLSGRFQNVSTPNGIYSYDDIRLVLAQFNEFNHPLGIEQLDYAYVTRLHDRPKMGRYSTYRWTERHPSELRTHWDRRLPYEFEYYGTPGWSVEMEENQATNGKKAPLQYRSAMTDDQYWNRTIVNRMEYPQNLKSTFASQK